MRWPMVCGRLRTALLVLLAMLLLIGPQSSLLAGEVRLKNGLVIEGKPVPLQNLGTQPKPVSSPTIVYPILMIETGVARYFVPTRQVVEINRDIELQRLETFTLPQKRTGGRSMVASLGSLVDVTPFDEFGRRRITLATERGPLHIVQGVTTITPKYLTVKGLTHVWEHGLKTSSIPPERLDAMLRKAIDPANPDDRLAVARFYLQAGQYMLAGKELDSIERDFPELKQRVAELGLELRQLQARQLLVELRRRRDAGQHRLAYLAAKSFPTQHVDAGILREVRELQSAYETARQDAARAIALLGDLQAELDDEQLLAEVSPLRSTLAEELDIETLPRLTAFFQFAGDDSVSAREKLALAYSGWVLGSAHAVTDLKAAIRFWEARLRVLDYIRSDDPNQRRELLRQLLDIEGVGPETVLQMIPLLPPILETPEVRPGHVARIRLDDQGGESPTEYAVLLPPEYNPHRAYPMLVVLHAAGHTPEREIQWWGGTAENPLQAQRHGYIVIAPEYAEPKQTSYDYAVRAHLAVLTAIRDARRRFHVDSDRVFIAGHGMGGDAVFDIAMSHPHLFAGAIPITGISDRYCKYYWQNAEHVAWYIVGGELDRDATARNTRELERMLRHRYDIVFAEYIGRGYESYYEEIHELFAWMELHRRARDPHELEMRVLRPFDNRFYWVQLDEMPANVMRPIVWEGSRSRRVSPMQLAVRITPGNTLYLRSGAGRHTLWLTPELVDFDQRLTVRKGSRQLFNDFVKPDIAAILDDFRIRADRQRLYWARLDLQ